ncbi:ceramide synthase schlank isoform X2 [Arctopsyche grandis]|uniref:ceramide synthase schlank isoform X2 n=1 Tax=Arctopsyche grandis TaxID=121162 RepID=UPI00406D9465
MVVALVGSYFWSESVWLPPNVTWQDIEPAADKPVRYTDYTHLLFPVPLALFVLLLRYLLEVYVFSGWGIKLGIKNSRPKKADYYPALEVAYLKSPKFNQKILIPLSKQLDLSDRQLERWWRKRRSQDKPSTLVKFCENAWRCTYYTTSTVYGIYILWDKEWLWDIDHCYLGYPHQGVTDDVWWHYMISLSFYWSLTVSQFFDIKRKDFWQMFIHHIATIMLMSFSWVTNLHRVGTLVLLLHDFADIFLEAAKITKYASYQKLCDCIFGVFTVLWIVTRLGIFPFYIIWSSSIRAPLLLPMFPAYYIFNSLLCLLLVLHVIWTWLILKVAYKALSAGQMEGDIRSSSSEISDSPVQSVDDSGRSPAGPANSSNSKDNNVKSRSNSATNSHNNSPKRTPNTSKKGD